MNVVIRHKHCIGTAYDHQNDGPLINACKEQLPEPAIVKEYDGYCIDSDGKMYSFDASNSGYNRLTYSALADKEIKEIKLDLVPVRLSGNQAVWDAG
jgi:hypothetical protein